MRRKARPGGGRQIEVRVERLGARGDGVARFEGRPLFLAHCLPGDLVRARLVGRQAGGFRAEVVEQLEEGPGRVVPPCPYFGPCGGCRLQHLEAGRYREWELDLLAVSMARHNLPRESLQPLITVAAGSRRRASLTFARGAAGPQLGFHGRQSHHVVDIDACLLLTAPLQALLPDLKLILGDLLAPGERGELALLDSDSGVDLLLRSPRAPDLAAREALAAFAEARDLARLSWGPPRGAPEPLAVRRSVRVDFAGVAVTPPPGGFLQPSAAGEAALVAALLRFLPPDAKVAADLFCGCGTFTFPLAARGLRVHGVEGDGPALAALWQAAKGCGLAGQVTEEQRDLARRPLSAAELDPYDFVVFDPPRAGAREQAATLAASSVATVVAISCSPATFGRDAALLIGGGYRLEEVVPLDQFPWSGHLELAAVFRQG